VYTDKNGYYKIVGLKEGLYYVKFKKKINDSFIRILPRKIIVKKGSLSRLDLRLKNRKKDR
jgi:hypothetical protein